MPFPAAIALSALAGSDGFVIEGASAFDASGRAVSAAGDVNGDGIDDLIVGAYGVDANGEDSGASYVVFGRTAGFATTIELSSLSGDEGFMLKGASASDFSGYAVSGAGDVNGDGIDDVIVGSYRAGPNGEKSGASHVVFGRTSGFPAVVELSSLAGSDGFVLDGASEYDRSGFSVRAAGDVNGDQIGDLIVGAPYAEANGSYSGRSYVVFGRTSGFAATMQLSSLAGTDGFALNGATAFGYSGRAVSAAGDVNGDGIDDVIVGVPYAGPNGNTSGAAHVVFGRTSAFAAVIELSSLSGSDGFVLNGATVGDYAGSAVAAAGDVNGDGIGDLLVGASGAGPNGISSGATYVVFGRTSGFAAAVELSSLSGSDGFVLNGVSGGDGSGRSVSAAGDVNVDGIDDLIVGARSADANGSNAGASYVIFGRTSGFAAAIELSSLSGSDGFVLLGASAGDASGISVSAAGDVNGDGFDDLIVGARGADPNGIYSGASYVIFGRPAPDDVPPAAPTVDAVADDTGTPGDGITTDRTLMISGTAEPFSIVRVFRGAALVDDTTADADGNWSLADPAMLAFGAHLYRAEAEDAAGNVSERSGPLQVFVVNPAALPSGGPDLVLGSAGANQIQGGEGNDTLFGEAGNDTLKGNNGNDWLFGGEGTDRLEGENGSDVANGGNGNDTVYGQNGNDTLRGDNGNDRLEGGAGLDSIDGGAGNDTLYGGVDRDTLFGGAGGDQLYGDADGDWLMLGGDAARDTVFGTIAHLQADTIDGFVDGMPTVPGADLVFVTAMTNAQRKEIDGDILDAQGRLFLPGGGSITFLGHAGAEVDAVNGSGGVQIWLV